MIKDILKNTLGWKTKRKLIVFSVDDYGNIRLGSRKAVLEMDKNGLKANSIFDLKDALETPDDLTSLYEVLYSVKDLNNRPACFTPFMVTANINFDAVRANGIKKFVYEPLNECYLKHEGNITPEIIQSGIKARLFVPQFHGREHLNINVFNKLANECNPDFIFNIKNNSYSRIKTDYPYLVAFYSLSDEDNEEHKKVIKSGLKIFSGIFGYKASNFMPSSSIASTELNQVLFNEGIKYIDSAIFKKNKRLKVPYYTGKQIEEGKFYLVRNVVFEPCYNRALDAVNSALKQIEYAFLCNKPAIISSHRVNFCGRIDESNRQYGLQELQRLLKMIIQKWPEAEFISAAELGDLIQKK